MKNNGKTTLRASTEGGKMHHLKSRPSAEVLRMQGEVKGHGASYSRHLEPLKSVSKLRWTLKPSEIAPTKQVKRI